jgi:thiol-disulfide isomerase/thioredoxin
MNSLHLGPFAISAGLALLLLCVIVALIVGQLVARGRRLPIADTLLTLALVGLVAARIVFVLQYFSEYWSAPWTIIDIRDGGFNVMGGLIGMAVYASWVVWRRPALRTPLASAMAAGLLSWAMIGGLVSMLDTTRLSRPDVVLTRLNGGPVQLADLALAHPDQPMVVNLWASWCPPCRVEMPTLVTAQKQHENVVFVFANQGESAKTVRGFLRDESLSPSNVLLDNDRRLARATYVRAYPTTLFFDADGQLIDRHVGMLSPATLARALSRLSNHPQESDP